MSKTKRRAKAQAKALGIPLPPPEAKGQPERLSVRQIALKILRGAGKPMSAHEIWQEAIRTGLAANTTSTAERPENALSGFLYNAAHEHKHGISGAGEFPVRYTLTSPQA